LFLSHIDFIEKPSQHIVMSFSLSWIRYKFTTLSAFPSLSIFPCFQKRSSKKKSSEKITCGERGGSKKMIQQKFMLQKEDDAPKRIVACLDRRMNTVRWHDILRWLVYEFTPFALLFPSFCTFVTSASPKTTPSLSMRGRPRGCPRWHSLKKMHRYRIQLLHHCA
jgi:hypothetical protein